MVYAVVTDQSISNLMGFMVAVTLSFYLNAIWTFKSRITLLRYMLLVVFMAMLSWFVGEIADDNQFLPIITPVLFSVISLVLGFLFMKHFVFRGTR